MAHFIAQLHDELYLYPRRSTVRYNDHGGRVGARSVWGEDIGQARVFTRRASATLAAKKSLPFISTPFKVHQVTLTIAGRDNNKTGSTT